MVEKLVKDYWKAAPEIVEHQEFDCQDAEIIVIAHGVVTRAAQAAIKELRSSRQKGRTFPSHYLKAVSQRSNEKAIANAKELIIVESAEGQLDKIVKAEIYGSQIPITGYFKPGVGITSEEIVEFINKKG